jgi:itaconate CoA-transferase
MDIAKQYQKKLLTPAQAVKEIAGRRNVILGMGLAMPPALIKAAAAALIAGRLDPIDLYYMHGTEVLQQSLLQPELHELVCPRPLFLSASDRKALKAGNHDGWIEFVPASFHEVGRLLTEHIEPDCFMVTVSRMDKHGYFSLGTNADYGATVIRKARKVIVEVNDYMPRTFGECLVHVSEVDSIVENHTPLIASSQGKATKTDKQIASQITEWIDDGDTLQMGIGGVPNTVLELLKNHQNLGLHSELFSPPMVDLIKRGVINGRKKTWMQHKHVYTLALGDQEMFDFMDDNPAVVGYPASWVNNPLIIRKNDNMVSVNAALEVDLTGQINAEQVEDDMFSGTGGQLDFVRGAYASRNGRSFIALHSTAKKGSMSRIVPKLKSGTVTDTRMDTHFVVTEYGCVNLKGLSIQQRAQALIELAHPDFRDELERQAIEQHLLRA